MKTILNKISLHPLFIITLFIFVLMGRFKFMCYFMLLILVHELGHIAVSFYFKWNIDKIIILPFGGLIKYNNYVNTPLKEDFLVSISGVIFQYIFYIITNRYISYSYYSIINYSIIIFNLLPIYPLDGSKILSVIINKLTNFYNSLKISVVISYIIIFLSILILFKINKIFIFIFIFLIIRVNKLSKNIKNIYNKFLLERYIHEFKFNKVKIINNIYKMKKDYRHIIYKDNNYITEKNILNEIFKYKSL